MAPRLDVVDLFGLVPAASLVLSGDTGVAHVPRLEPDFPR
jgi:hypothetical protein